MNSQLESLAKAIKRKKKKKKRCKVITVSSGKGGVGKTGVSISLAYALSSIFGKKVLLLDCDIGLGNVHVVLNLRPDKSIRSLLNGEKIENVIQSVKGLDVILGFSGIESFIDFESFESADFIYQLEKVFENYDYVVIDNAAGLNKQTVSFSRIADSTYIVTTPEPTALTDAYAFVKSMYKLYDYSSFKVIINMCASKREGYKTYERLRDSAKTFLGLNLPLVGILPFSERVKECLLKKKLILESYPSDPYSLEIKRIVQLEVGEIIKEDLKEGFISRLLGFLK
ncbi:flagellar biosynthesis protein FlhG [Desulfurobacterium pacificum]|uniref:Flagellar biosynthesis protein FlhG n=1 Tax=Desulfurobacterium pacificum TaxID=240166 RepID=A0ABY1NML7_9BACT|nr:AAA family ATPase [Desulfurobacterium pacificum]SMP13756.1 flagellar biosynthesis protein FlhG [Desulfurobacterium pacificum]